MLKNMFLLSGTVASRRLVQTRFATLAAGNKAVTPFAAASSGLRQFSTAVVKPKNGVAMHIDSYKEAENKYSIDIRLASHLHIPYSLDTTLKVISDALFASKNDEITKVTFFSLTGGRLPLCEKIANLR